MVAVGYLVTVTGPLLLFNPVFVSLQQARHGVPERLGVDRQAIDRVTRELLLDLFVGGEFDASLDGAAPILDDSERSHMRDVGALVRTMALVDLLALAAVLATGWVMRADRGRRGRLLVVAAGTVGGAALVVGLLFAVAFDAAFLAFHRLFFREGTFTFGPDSNLIRLFPQAFWFEASLAAGALVVASAGVVAFAGWRATR